MTTTTELNDVNPAINEVKDTDSTIETAIKYDIEERIELTEEDVSLSL